MIFRIALLTLVIGIAGCGGGTSSSSTPNNPSATLITLETATGNDLARRDHHVVNRDFQHQRADRSYFHASDKRERASDVLESSVDRHPVRERKRAARQRVYVRRTVLCAVSGGVHAPLTACFEGPFVHGVRSTTETLPASDLSGRWP
jgi:hypothetical protein